MTSGVGQDSDFAQASALHQAGRLDDAERSYSRTLQRFPGHADALHGMGVLLHQKGFHLRALSCVEQSIAIAPTAQAFSNLAAIQLSLGEPLLAQAACHRALAITPQHVEARLNLGRALEALGRHAEERAILLEVSSLGRDDAELWRRLGVANSRLGADEQAVECFLRAIHRDASSAEAHYNLGLSYQNLERYPEAISSYRTALTLKPDYLNAALNLGIIHKEMGSLAEAEAMYKAALDIDPAHAVVNYNLSVLYKKMGRVSPALAAARQAIKTSPCFADAYLTLGNALHSGAMLEAAIAAFRLGHALKPEDPDIHKNLNACLRERADLPGAELREAYRSWSMRHIPTPARGPHVNDPNPARKLRIGYVSSDLRNHAVAYFMEPIVERHDRAQVEVYCYAEVAKPDDVTARIRKSSDHWRDIYGMKDRDAAAMIEADAIDVLIDCVGHTIGNRLQLFGLRPAPVQLTSLIGNETTTGMSAIPYALTDNYLTPPGFEDQFTEELVRLPRVVAPFRPRTDWPDIAAEPPGDVVFACFAAPGRIGADAKGMWRQILDRVPGSRLLLKHRTFNTDDQRHYWARHFAEFGDRLELQGVHSWAREMTVYAQVSVMLDAYPITGATSSLIPLWMGVPVVSLAGRLSGQRFGLTMLSNAGVPELVTSNPEDYVTLAARLATDPSRLRHYRATIRDTMRASPLLDERGVAADLEAAYRQLWVRWCQSAKVAA